MKTEGSGLLGSPIEIKGKTLDGKDFDWASYKGKVVLIACPKLVNAAQHTEKLAQIFAHNRPRSISVVRMEVPCCGGLRMMTERALSQAGVQSVVEELVVTIKGEVMVKR